MPALGRERDPDRDPRRRAVDPDNQTITKRAIRVDGCPGEFPASAALAELPFMCPTRELYRFKYYIANHGSCLEGFTVVI